MVGSKQSAPPVKENKVNFLEGQFFLTALNPFVQKRKLRILDHATHRLKKKHFSGGLKTNKVKITYEVTCANIFCRKN